MILDKFPNAKAIATPESFELMEEQGDADVGVKFWNSLFPNQLPEKPTIAAPLHSSNEFEIEAHKFIVNELALATRMILRSCTFQVLTWWFLVT